MIKIEQKDYMSVESEEYQPPKRHYKDIDHQVILNLF